MLWVGFTDVEQLRPGRRMRAHERDTEVFAVDQLRLLGGRPNIRFTNGAGLAIAAAKKEPWQIEVEADGAGPTQAQPVRRAQSDNPRVPIPHETREMAVELLLNNLRRRLDRHGYNSHAGTHEGLGIITEEYHELIEAVRSDQNHRVISEALDVGAACLWLVATLLEKDPDARRAGSSARPDPPPWL